MVQNLSQRARTPHMRENAHPLCRAQAGELEVPGDWARNTMGRECMAVGKSAAGSSFAPCCVSTRTVLRLRAVDQHHGC